MRKVAVIASGSGNGKTTLGRELARLGQPLASTRAVRLAAKAVIVGAMLGWFRAYFERRAERARAAEEKEFFDAWDEMGWPDYDTEGNEIHPVWDAAAGRWTYPHRDNPDIANPS